MPTPPRRLRDGGVLADALVPDLAGTPTQPRSLSKCTSIQPRGAKAPSIPHRPYCDLSPDDTAVTAGLVPCVTTGVALTVADAGTI